jgi:transposase InsO family protein
VPELQVNLFSIPAATRRGYGVAFGDAVCTITAPDGATAATGVRTGSLFKLLARAVLPAASACVVADASDGELWHRRLGHAGVAAVKALQENNMVDGLDAGAAVALPTPCVACLQGKQHAAAVPKVAEHRAMRPLELVHSDVVGPMPTMSHAGHRFIVTIVDDYSRKTWAVPVRTKADTPRVLQEFKALAEAQTGHKLLALRSDNGGEYESAELNQFLAEHGVRHERSAPHTPQQNGVAERANRSIVEMARTLLHQGGVERRFWPEAVVTATYIKNRLPHRGVLVNKTPEEIYTGVRPSVAHLRVFGCAAFVLVPESERDKLAPKTKRCVFLGYTAEPTTYRLFCPDTGKMLTSRNVVFDEASVCHDRRGDRDAAPAPAQPPDGPADAARAPDAHEVVPAVRAGPAPVGVAPAPVVGQGGVPDVAVPVPAAGVPDNAGADVRAAAPAAHDEDGADSEYVSSGSEADAGPEPRRSTRVRRRAADHPFWMVSPRHQALVSAADVGAGDEPKTLAEALARPDATKWRAAVDEELQSLVKNGVYELVDLPPGRTALACKYVFKIKHNADGTVERYKARLVAKGYTQVAGIDYGETFAPVVKYATIRVLLALAAAQELELQHMDVKTAFLNGELEEEIYMVPPEGVLDEGEHGKVWRLHKALYGLKQSPRMWNKKLDDFMAARSFRRCEADPSVYVKAGAIVAVYVDDLIICGPMRAVADIKAELGAAFEMKDLGAVHWLLGIEVQRDGRVVRLNHAKYIAELLATFRMADCKPASTPMAIDMLTADMCPRTDDERRAMAGVPYASAVGSLMYVMVATRPDLAAAVSVVSRYMANPGPAHWTAVKRILRYLRGTADWELRLSGDDTGSVVLSGYCDADWAGDKDRRRSVTGYAFTLGTGAVTWSSKAQHTVALSSTEAEYMAASHAAREALWLRELLRELGHEQATTEIKCDNQGAIALVKNPVHHQRTKHIDVQHHFIRELHERAVIALAYCETARMAADIMTKALGRDKHRECCAVLGLGPVEQRE